MTNKKTKTLPKNFNPNRYAQAYPDVTLSGLDPATHYIKYGHVLGRSPSPTPQTRIEPRANSTPALLEQNFLLGVLPNVETVRHPELISIIMPSHNNEEWLAQAIHSALSQQGVNVEVILIDDGSTDGSVGLARQIGKSAPNLKVISLLRNFGCYYARNIGVQNATGKFIAILDADDIMAPDRLAKQLDALKSSPDAVACRCQQRRWTSNYTAPLSDLKNGENSLIWRRDVIKRIGWYDTVRYSGDAEFRLRIEKTYGSQSVIKLSDELYYTRTRSGSLTTSPQSQVFDYQDRQLSVAISPNRVAYEKSFRAWQNSPKRELYIPFPQLSRPFELGDKSQNSSPSLNQRRVGMMASFPARCESLKAVLPQILPQLDELRLYLNDYEDIPEFAKDAKICAVLGKNAKGDLRDNGKFYNLPSDKNSYIFTLDDDLLYPDDYVARMIHAVEMLDRTCVVGVHGVNFPGDRFDDLAQRQVFEFRRQATGHFVDLLGTGTTAWHSATFQPKLDDFLTMGVCDLWFAVNAAKQNIPLYSIPRAKNWLRDNVRHEKSLYHEALEKPDGYFKVYHEEVAPVLQNGRIRREIGQNLSRGYDADTLVAAGISLPGIETKATSGLIKARRNIVNLPPLDAHNAPEASKPQQRLKFHIVVNGWNCHEYLADCIRSIAWQLPADYSCDVTLIDDNSDDGTYEALMRTAILPFANIIRIEKNTGPAHARHIGITSIEDPNTIVVLLDMDDALEPHALRTVAQRYRDNPECLITIGNWHDQDGKKNPQGFYTAEDMNGQKTREVELFNATHLRTFRRQLYDAIQPEDLLDQEGNWLETCTDVALMYPLLDQCYSSEVEFIDDPIYIYNRKHATGTLARFGKPHKVERLKWLKGKPPKSRMQMTTIAKGSDRSSNTPSEVKTHDQKSKDEDPHPAGPTKGNYIQGLPQRRAPEPALGVQKRKYTFIANRTDGFGERLRAVLNALVAARHYQGTALINWDVKADLHLETYHALRSSSETFSQEFLESHYIGLKEMRALSTIEAKDLDYTDDGHILVPDSLDGIILSQNWIETQFSNLEIQDAKALYQNTFEDITFSDPLEYARNKASKVDVGPQCVALHLRAGDVIYGQFRITAGYVGKGIPYPIGEALIKILLEKGHDVIVFGQDLKLGQYLKKNYNIRLAADFSDYFNFDKYQSVIFEICLMSRCNHIFAGSSGFATLATWVGRAIDVEVEEYLDEDVIINSILSLNLGADQDVSDLQKAYAYSYLLHKFPNRISQEKSRALTSRCLKLDPENVLYTVMTVADLYATNRVEQAEEILLDYSNLPQNYSLDWTLQKVHPANLVRIYLNEFKAPAEGGAPMAALCLAIRAKALGQIDEAKNYAKIYQTNKGSIKTILEAHLDVF